MVPLVGLALDVSEAKKRFKPRVAIFVGGPKSLQPTSHLEPLTGK